MNCECGKPVKVRRDGTESKYCRECAAVARGKWRDMIEAKAGEREARAAGFAELWARAVAAGNAAAAACVPVPMIVGSPGADGRIDPNRGPVHFVAGGVCGFAWVSVRPGNSAFANWLKANGLARRDSYAGGVAVWVTIGGQSMEVKAAYADAMAEVFQAAGVRAIACSRMD